MGKIINYRKIQNIAFTLKYENKKVVNILVKHKQAKAEAQNFVTVNNFISAIQFRNFHTSSIYRTMIIDTLKNKISDKNKLYLFTNDIQSSGFNYFDYSWDSVLDKSVLIDWSSIKYVEADNIT